MKLMGFCAYLPIGLRKAGRIVSSGVAAGLLSVTVALAGEADVLNVEVFPEDGGTYRFDVTVLHEDKGLENYADKWQVLGPDGKIYGERVLTHPHVNEQPFTRSQTGISIPNNFSIVVVRAHSTTGGWGGKSKAVPLPDRQ